MNLKRNSTKTIKVILFLLTLATGLNCLAADKSKPANRKPASAEISAPRQKNLKFEENVVEGMNQRSHDSLSQLGENSKRINGHLYRKRADFNDEMQELYRETEYSK